MGLRHSTKVIYNCLDKPQNMKTPNKLWFILVLGLALSACSTGTNTSESQEVIHQENEPVNTKPVADNQPVDAPKEVEERNAEARKNVLDYYQSLEPPYSSFYKLTLKGEKWVTQSSADYEIEAVVNIPGGFIEIVDDGTGGGTDKVQVALFRMADGQPMLAICKQNFDGVGVAQEYYFLHPEDQKQYDWTEHTLGALSVYDFLELDYAEEPELLEEAMPVIIELPQKGTTLTATVFKGQQFLYCDDNATPAQKIVCPAFDRLRTESIQLAWDRSAGQFLFPSEE